MSPFKKVLYWVTTFIIPFFLLMTSIRLLFSPLYLNWEYNRPGFPPDPYGFTKEDRIRWGSVSLDYMHNHAGIEFLANQRLPGGAPLYNERELSHMLDVKILFQKMVVAWYVLLAVLVGVQLYAWRSKDLPAFWLAIARGGMATGGLILAILIAVALSFQWLFTVFHQIFFTGDTWLFSYSDNLIRLFPIPFWQDAFILLGVISLAEAALLVVAGRWLAQKLG